MRIDVTDDKLASVLIVDKRLEECPEPYRCNGDNDIIVRLSVYRSFISRYLSVNDYLATDTFKLRAWNNSDSDDMICQCFYRDMALAIMKEVWYTESGSKPSHIIHEIEGSDTYPQEYVTVLTQAFAKELNKARKDLVKVMKDRDYDIPINKLVTYGTSVDYAVLLYAMSYSDVYNVPFSKWSLERRETC